MSTKKRTAKSLDQSKKASISTKSFKILSFDPVSSSLSEKRSPLSGSPKSIDNISDFKKFMVKPTDIGLNITVVPQRTYVYQGVDYKFKWHLGKEKYMEDFYNVFNNNQDGAYFVSSRKAASMYGLQKDLSIVVYTTIPDKTAIKRPTNEAKYIYPLYYIPGQRGSNIKYKFKKDMYLLDIGDIKNIQFLWSVINDMDIDKQTKEEYKEVLYNTCAHYTKGTSPKMLQTII
jgi:hypothetical protein